MLKRPDIDDEKIVACLRDEYRLTVAQVAFLPIGADANAAVYRVVAEDEKPYFLKLKRGFFEETSVALPKYLSEQGIRHVIAPLATKSGSLWANLDSFKTILYPFVVGHDGYDVELTDRQWFEFGAALKSIHALVLPPSLIGQIQEEMYSPQWRESVRMFLGRVEDERFDEPVELKLAAFLRSRHEAILDLVANAERLAAMLAPRPHNYVLCHSDIHARNILIDGNDAFHIIDWDNPILAPKERDLMFIGGAQGFAGHTAEEEEVLFYRGYGQTDIDTEALAYYRYERIVEDIAAFCEQIFLTAEGGKDRERALDHVITNFLPNNTIEIAYRSDKTRREY